MRKNYKPLGKYIQPVGGRNSELGDLPLMGLSITKQFIPSIANIIGTDMSTYRIIERNQFAYGPVTSRNGDKITIALFNDYEKALISQAYIPFEVKDTNELDPEYLMMWFRRPEFDRYARFKSHGSAREIFDWAEMCNTLLPVPHIDKQREIVKEYNTVVNRIKLNQQLIQKLEETAQAIYKQWFVDFEFPDENGLPYKSNGGKMEFNKELEIEIPKSWVIKKLADFCDIKGGKRLPKGKELNNDKRGNSYIKVADMSNPKFITLNEQIQYVDEETQKSISRYIVSKGDVIISIVGTIGLVNVISETLDKANLTENCVRLTNLKEINSDFIYHYLFSTVGQRIIETKIVGGVQGKLPLYNIQSIPVIYPNIELLKAFEKIMMSVNATLKNSTMQNDRLSFLKDLLLSKLATIEN
ncbi:MAG: restriction endonuclease subunit S [Prolixibacteraceae bacterium]|nr:restriction endonuclease subunit S [Prolixibacteraceae bacterium]